MLINFIFKNYRSFYDEQTLSLQANHDKEMMTSLSSVSKELLPNNYGVLKNLMIFGQNSSGKTNLLRAIEYMKKVVMLSSSMNIVIENEPFALLEGASQQDSHYELEFIQNGNFYKYGFVINNYKIVHEWLFKRTERLTPIFKRSRDELKIIGLSRNEASKLTPSPTTLFLSIAENLQLEITPYIRDARLFFKNLFFIYEDDRQNLNLYLENEKYIQYAQELINKVDLGFSELKILKLGSYIDAQLSQNVYSSSHEVIKKHNIRIFQDKAVLGDGIRALICRLPILFKALESGGTVFINDLGSILHVHIAAYLQDLFKESILNTKGAQLISTTTLSMLMDQGLRRDQIYIVDRDKEGKSSLYRLSEKKNVRKSDIYSKKYIKGDYSQP